MLFHLGNKTINVGFYHTGDYSPTKPQFHPICTIIPIGFANIYIMPKIIS